jgi:hypothetical protein
VDTDTWIGGRILHEYEIHPAGVEALGVVFDVTRQIEYRDYYITNGTGIKSPDGQKTFPWLQTPPKDNESPNDDEHDDDEQNTPANRHIYSFDAFGVQLPTSTKAFVISRNTLKEWVRVQLKNTAFKNQQNEVEGSRASHKVQWYLLYYVKRDASGNLVEDNTNPSYNTPVFTGTGNGAIAVTLLANAVTEGFTATYDLANLKWTLSGTSSDSVSDQKGSAPQGTQWTLTIANKITVVITQGSTAFANGDKFVFSVFKSTATATGGKRNEIGLGYVDVTDGP